MVTKGRAAYTAWLCEALPLERGGEAQAARGQIKARQEEPFNCKISLLLLFKVDQ